MSSMKYKVKKRFYHNFIPKKYFFGLIKWNDGSFVLEYENMFVITEFWYAITGKTTAKM